MGTHARIERKGINLGFAEHNDDKNGYKNIYSWQELEDYSKAGDM